MKPRFTEDIIPISEFRRKTSSYLKDIRATGRTVILTQDGHSAAVVLSPEIFEQMEYERELLSAIARGEKEIEEGQGIPHQQVFKNLLHRFKS